MDKRILSGRSFLVMTLGAGVGLLVASCVMRLEIADLRHLVKQDISGKLAMSVCSTVSDPEIDCVVCHAGAKTETYAGMPDRETCLECHAGLPSVGLFDLGGEHFDKNGKTKWIREVAVPSNIFFSHEKHKDSKCEECHGDIKHRDFSLIELAEHNANCRRCHSLMEDSGQCDACHLQMDKEARPHSHDLAWPEAHGWMVREFGGNGRVDQVCNGCHDNKYCIECHQNEKPKGHTVMFVRAGHGMPAAMDRDRCATCHSEAQCLRCHLSGSPRTSPLCDAPPPRACTAPGCHDDKMLGHTILATNCQLCHR